MEIIKSGAVVWENIIRPTPDIKTEVSSRSFLVSLKQASRRFVKYLYKDIVKCAGSSISAGLDTTFSSFPVVHNIIGWELW